MCNPQTGIEKSSMNGGDASNLIRQQCRHGRTRKPGCAISDHECSNLIRRRRGSRRRFLVLRAPGGWAGDYFRSCLTADIDSLVFYAGVHERAYGYYRALSKRFPFAIYYQHDRDTVTVVAVLDVRRSPQWTRKRLISAAVANDHRMHRSGGGHLLSCLPLESVSYWRCLSFRFEHSQQQQG